MLFLRAYNINADVNRLITSPIYNIGSGGRSSVYSSDDGSRLSKKGEAVKEMFIYSY